MLTSATFTPPHDDDAGRDPFTVPAVRATPALAFRAPVTFFVGENGSGKSTWLEAIAAAAGLPAVGSDDVAGDTMLADLVAGGAQFVVATHSPILLAFPGAEIYSFDELPARVVPYAELEHVRLTREFLAAPERFLRHLTAERDGS